MRQRTATLASLIGPLFAASGSPAEFQGISFEPRPNEFGLKVFSVYANFNEPLYDHLEACFGDGGRPGYISVIGGTFYQSPFGSDAPPNPLLFSVFPTLRYDTFVTIAVESFNPSNPGVPEGQPENVLFLTPLWPGFGPATLDLTFDFGAGWGVKNDAPQGQPFNPSFVAGDGRVLIAQLGTFDGIGFEGLLQLYYHADGFFNQASVKFSYLFCPWDLDGSGVVSVTDFLALLQQWGTDPAGPPDFDGDGSVGTVDLLDLLGHWGACP